MKSRKICISLLAPLFAVGFLIAAAAPGQADSHATTGVAVSETVTLTAKVVGVNPSNRIVTLAEPDGKLVDIVAGDEVRDFNQIKVGDSVTATFYQSVALYLGAPGTKPEIAATESMTSAEKDDKPSAMAVGTIDVSAVVMGLDKPKRLVTLQTPEGKLVTSKVDPSVDTFDSVKVGDTIHARITRAVAISVEAP